MKTYHKIFPKMNWAVHLHSKYADKDGMYQVSTICDSAERIQNSRRQDFVHKTCKDKTEHKYTIQLKLLSD